ncbi:MAG: hypothetical protein ACR2NN_07405, partial [Bryobacteraceae bacterium]
LSCQRPLERAYEQDPIRVARWKKAEFPAIRALAREAGAEIWFGDESGVRSDYHSGTTWGGERHHASRPEDGAAVQVRMLLISSLHALQRLPQQIQSFFQLPDTRYAACEQ